jgi:hypothetical protein
MQLIVEGQAAIPFSEGNEVFYNKVNWSFIACNYIVSRSVAVVVAVLQYWCHHCASLQVQVFNRDLSIHVIKYYAELRLREQVNTILHNVLLHNVLPDVHLEL